MWSFLADLFRNADSKQTVVLMDSDEVGTGRRYELEPRRLLRIWGTSLLGVGVVVGVLFFFTPLRTLIPGYGTKEIKNQAQLNAMRVEALQDSVRAQRHYIQRLRRLITGGVDTVAGPNARPTAGAPSETAPPEFGQGAASGAESGDDASSQSSLSPRTFMGLRPTGAAGTGAATGLSFPVEPPVTNGFPTRGFDAETSHYGVDVAVSEGTYVRAVARGYVVIADWTRDGGNTVVVQHPGGYLSVYKHNKRLLKQIGDRVRARDPVAVSGNTGEITTGPHLHFELWRNGLVQNPKSYIAGW